MEFSIVSIGDYHPTQAIVSFDLFFFWGGGLFSLSRIFHSFGFVIITDKNLHTFTYAFKAIVQLGVL